jgi:cytochrome c oxidase subunit 3
MSALAQVSTAEKIQRNRWGLWLFFLTEVSTFGTFLMLRFALWGDTRPELNQVAGLIATIILLASSFSMNRAEIAIKHGDKKNFNIGMLVTMLMGVLFFLMIATFEWGLIYIPGLSGHLQPFTSTYGSVLFLMTGMHGLHVLMGLIFVLYSWLKGRRGDYANDNPFWIESCALFWHFVDLVWIFFYPALYLIGKAVL